MITRINSIKKFTRIEEFQTNTETSDFTEINLVYGGNGVGKTTLTNLIRLFSNEPIDVKNKILGECKNGDDFYIELKTSSGIKKLDKKHAHEGNILVFNQSFVEDHVFNGKTINAKGFADNPTKDQLTSPTILKLNEELKSLNGKNQTALDCLGKIEASFLKQKNKVSKHVNAKVASFRMPPMTHFSSIPSLNVEVVNGASFEEVDELCNVYNLVLNQDFMVEEIRKIKLFTLNSINENFLNLKDVLSRNIAANAQNRVRSVIENIPASINGEDWRRWFKNGQVLIEEFQREGKQECPLCGSREISLGVVLDVLNDFFTDEWKQLQSDLQKAKDGIVGVRIKCESALENIGSLNNSLKKIKREEFDLDFLIAKKKELTELLAELNLLCVTKEKHPATLPSPFDEKLIINVDSLILELNAYFEEVQAKQEAILKDVEESFISSGQIEGKIKTQVKPLIVKCMLEDGFSHDVFLEFDTAKKEIEATGSSIKRLQLEISNEVKKLKAEASLINNHLKKLGFFNFSVDFNSNSNSGILITYENGKTRSELDLSLSEGEKTGLSFAYFLSKIQHEVLLNPDKNASNFIVLIDDPISSLDDNRLYSTSFIIKEFFKDFSQLFVLSHNLNFLKFFGSLVEVKKRSDYLIEFRDGTLSLRNIPISLTNFGTTYYLKLNDLLNFQNGKITYDNAKKFVPTHSRIVLESFLSFKFFVLKQGRGNERFMTPGLSQIIRLLESQKGVYKHLRETNGINPDNVCDKLEYIRRATDSHAHGGNHLLDEFIFMTETELNELCKDTLSIVMFFDNIHYEKAVVGD